MDLSLYTEKMYRASRKAKMYLINYQVESPARSRLEQLLTSVQLLALHLRFTYARFTEDPATDLRANYPEKLLLAFVTWGLTRNVPYQIENIYCDHNHFIFDIQVQAADRVLRKTLAFLLNHKASVFASTIECRIHIKGERVIRVVLESYRPGKIMEPLLEGDMDVPRYPAVQTELPVTEAFLKTYYAFLEEHYDVFYEEVKHRACTVWLYRQGWGEYQPRRYLDTKPIFFPPTYDELEPLLVRYPMVAIVPNSTREDMEQPVELTIDLDPPAGMPYEVVRATSNVFAEWLTRQGFQYSRRLTGSLQGGQHFVIPLADWSYPHLLLGKTELLRDYQKRRPIQILCDSVRCTAELLVLAFRKEHLDLAPIITTKIFNPYVRYQRFLFDISINTYNRGRRALCSAHQSSLGICVSLVEECPPTREALQSYVSLDRLSSGDDIFQSVSKPTPLVKHYNTQLLKRLIKRYERLYYQYGTTVPERFEHMHLNMPLPGLDADPEAD